MAGSVQVRRGLQAGTLWADEVLQLAEQLEALAKREQPATLQEVIDAGADAYRFLFLAFEPAWLARSLRLSARMHLPVLANPAPLDRQADAVFALRDRLHNQADQVTVPVLLPEARALDDDAEAEPPARSVPLQEEHRRPPGWWATEEVVERIGVTQTRLIQLRKAGAIPAELWTQPGRRVWWSPEVADLPILNKPRPAPTAPVVDPALLQPRPLRPRSERMRMEPLPRTPEELAALEEARQRREQRIAARQPAAPAAETAPAEQPEQQAPRAPRRPAAAPPPGWFTAEEAAEMLEAHSASVSRWRRSGLLGEEGTGWVKAGRGYYYAPAAVEQLEGGEIPAGLDELLAEVQADP